MKLLEQAMQSSHCVISVIGSHAGERIIDILQRKKADIEKIGKTFWIIQSRKARPADVQALCKLAPTYALFIESASKGGAKNTKYENVAREYSEDKKIWYPLPKGLTPVTGKLDSQTTALIFNEIEDEVIGIVDLWKYGDAFGVDNPLEITRGCSTVCAIRKDNMTHPGRIKSSRRKLIAVARLISPYGVSIR